MIKLSKLLKEVNAVSTNARARSCVAHGLPVVESCRISATNIIDGRTRRHYPVAIIVVRDENGHYAYMSITFEFSHKTIGRLYRMADDNVMLSHFVAEVIKMMQKK